MRNRFLLPLVLLLGALAPIAIAADDDDMTRITVKVTDESGAPIDRANVRVAFREPRLGLPILKRQTSWEMKTSQEGTVTMPTLQKGKILIQVTAEWHQSFGDTFEVEENERTIEVTLKEPQGQVSAHPPLEPADSDSK